jgi:hypothetical protein
MLPSQASRGPVTTVLGHDSFDHLAPEDSDDSVLFHLLRKHLRRDMGQVPA